MGEYVLGVCSRCRQRPKHVYPGGSRSPYCDACLPEVRRDTRRKQKEQQKSIQQARPLEVHTFLLDDRPALQVPRVQDDEAMYGLLAKMTLLVDQAYQACMKGTDLDTLHISARLHGGVTINYEVERTQQED